MDRADDAPPVPGEGRSPAKPVFPWFHREPPADVYEVRCLVDDLRAKQRRGRLTVPAYLAGALWFLTMGVVYGAWAPAGLLASACALGALVSWRFRRDRRERIARLEARLDAAADAVDGDDGSTGPGDGR